MQPNCWHRGDSFNVNKAIRADDELPKCNNDVISIKVDEVAPQKLPSAKQRHKSSSILLQFIAIFAVYFADHRFSKYANQIHKGKVLLQVRLRRRRLPRFFRIIINQLKIANDL